MTRSTTNETRIEADPKLPTIRMTREFEAPRDRVYRAWTEPELVVQWLGGPGSTMRIDRWDARTGGSYRYVTESEESEGGDGFFGSFHELRPNERLVWTFTYEGYPDGVCLETMTFEDVGNGRTRVTSLSVFDTVEGRDGMISSGMESGVVASYERLDALLAKG